MSAARDDGTPNRLAGLLASDVPVVATNYSDAVTDAELEHAAHDLLDAAEIRVDWFSSTEPDHVVEQLGRFGGFPTLATIRIAAEGGEWRGSVDDRIDLFRAVLPHVDGIDVELQTADEMADVIAEARVAGRVVVISTHDFEATPSDDALDDIVARGKAAGADYVKVAALATSSTDLARLTAFTLRHAHRGIIVIAMGVHGSASRVFLPLIGSRLTYAFGTQGRALSGQLPFPELFRQLRRFSPAFDEVKARLSRNRPEAP